MGNDGNIFGIFWLKKTAFMNRFQAFGGDVEDARQDCMAGEYFPCVSKCQ